MYKLPLLEDPNNNIAEVLVKSVPSSSSICTVRPMNAVKGRYNRYSDETTLDLVFFSPFEDLYLQTSGTMETNGIRKLYERSPVPTLYVGRIEDLLGRMPLFPCFLDGNTTSTIPHKYAPRQKQAFE